MRLSRRLRLTVVVLVLLFLGVGRGVEMRRLSVALPRDPSAPAPARLDAERMVLDLQVLASPRFQGRATDTPGGALAGQLVSTRFHELGLTPFGSAFEQPFTFVHRSVRALVRRDRPFARTFTGARNIVGYVRGTRLPDEVIVVSAHFDHLGVVRGDLYPGADDNASGTAALLAIAAWVHAHPLARTVVFAAFDAEELGLRGSTAFVEHLPFPRGQLRLNLNIDMIGRGDHGRLIVSGVRDAPAVLAPLALAAARTSAVRVHEGYDRPTWLTGLMDDWTQSSDQGPFHDIGVPFLYFGVEDHADVHEPTDTADRIDPVFYRAAAETVLSALLEAGK